MEAGALDPSHPNPSTGQAGGEPLARTLVAARARRRRRAWTAFFAVAALIVLVDQALKAWVVATYVPDQPVELFGSFLRIDFIHNSGGLFGILQNSVGAFAVMSVVVVVFIVALELRSGWRSWAVTIALTLLLGGAIGNFIDRVRLGYVIDFFDMGVGPWRWYIFNVADAAVTVAIAMLLVLSFVAPAALSLSEPEGERAAAAGPTAAGPTAAGPTGAPDRSTPDEGLQRRDPFGVADQADDRSGADSPDIAAAPVPVRTAEGAPVDSRSDPVVG